MCARASGRDVRAPNRIPAITPETSPIVVNAAQSIDVLRTAIKQKGRACQPARLCVLRALGASASSRGLRDLYFRCLFTSFVISNMLTLDLPPKTGFSASSALIIRLFFASCSLFFLM